jgi:hypothetical protein
MRSHLRLFPHSEDEAAEAAKSSSSPAIRVQLGELFPLLVQAQRGNYRWLDDFEEDEVAISPDLYDVLKAFRRCRPA